MPEWSLPMSRREPKRVLAERLVEQLDENLSGMDREWLEVDDDPLEGSVFTAPVAAVADALDASIPEAEWHEVRDRIAEQVTDPRRLETATADYFLREHRRSIRMIVSEHQADTITAALGDWLDPDPVVEDLD